MDRNELLAQAKTNALKLLDAGQVREALASVLLDLTKHPALVRHADLPKLKDALKRRDAVAARTVIQGMQ